MRCAIQIEGNLDSEVFQQAFQILINRHEILRTKFYSLPGGDVPMQVIRKHTRCSCPTISLEALNALDRATQLDEYFVAAQEKLFNLESESLVHATLLRMSAHSHILL